MAPPPVAQLRQLIGDCFDQEELRTLCVDLDIDYDSLPGTGKSARIRALIEYCARQNRLRQLVEYCAVQRPTYDWATHLQAIKDHPDQFLPDAIDVAGGKIDNSQPTHGPIVLNANRALKIGFAAGALVVALFGCGLVSGLLASQVISVNPVQPSQQALQNVTTKLQVLRSQASVIAIPSTPSNGTGADLPATPERISTLNLSSREATSFADSLLRRLGNQVEIHDGHVRFEEDLVVVTFRQKGTNRQMTVAYTVRAQRGRLVLAAQSAWVHLIEIRGSTIGWFPIPVSWASETTTWIQQLINKLTDDFYFTRVGLRPDEMIVAGVRTRR